MSVDPQKVAESLREVNAGFRKILADLQKLDQKLSRQLVKEVEG